MRVVCDRAIDIIKEFESLSLTSYVCPAGKWTVGYGHTGPAVGPDQEITEEAALNLLRGDVIEAAVRLDHYLEKDLTDNQFGAVVSLVFNIGIGNFKESTLLNKLNAEDFEGAAEEFLRWDKIAGKESAGLLRRRVSEKELFCST